MALPREMVDLVGLHLPNEPVEARRVGQVGVVELQAPRDPCRRKGGDRIEAAPLYETRLPNETVDLVTVGKERLGKVRTVLAGDPGDECPGHKPPVPVRHDTVSLEPSNRYLVRPALIAARLSRSASRRLIVSRLSWSFLPVTRAISTLARGPRK